jgi:hypothetical protein
MLAALGKASGNNSKSGARKAALGNTCRGYEARPLDLTPTRTSDFPLRSARFRLTDTAMQSHGRRQNNRLQ